MSNASHRLVQLCPPGMPNPPSRLSSARRDTRPCTWSRASRRTRTRRCRFSRRTRGRRCARRTARRSLDRRSPMRPNTARRWLAASLDPSPNGASASGRLPLLRALLGARDVDAAVAHGDLRPARVSTAVAPGELDEIRPRERRVARLERLEVPQGFAQARVRAVRHLGVEPDRAVRAAARGPRPDGRVIRPRVVPREANRMGAALCSSMNAARSDRHARSAAAYVEDPGSAEDAEAPCVVSCAARSPTRRREARGPRGGVAGGRHRRATDDDGTASDEREPRASRIGRHSNLTIGPARAGAVAVNSRAPAAALSMIDVESSSSRLKRGTFRRVSGARAALGRSTARFALGPGARSATHARRAAGGARGPALFPRRPSPRPRSPRGASDDSAPRITARRSRSPRGRDPAPAPPSASARRARPSGRARAVPDPLGDGARLGRRRRARRRRPCAPPARDGTAGATRTNPGAPADARAEDCCQSAPQCVLRLDRARGAPRRVPRVGAKSGRLIREDSGRPSAIRSRHRR